MTYEVQARVNITGTQQRLGIESGIGAFVVTEMVIEAPEIGANGRLGLAFRGDHPNMLIVNFLLANHDHSSSVWYS